MACLAASIRNDTVFVSRILALDPAEADSMGIASSASVERCGPPEWAGTVHTHVAMYTDSLPSTRFSAQDRGVMQRWYERWHSDGVFCVVYSARDAHCEADGVVGGMRVAAENRTLAESGQEKGRLTRGDLGLLFAIQASNPQVRPARTKKKTTIRVKSTRWNPCWPGDIHCVARP